MARREQFTMTKHDVIQSNLHQVQTILLEQQLAIANTYGFEGKAPAPAQKACAAMDKLICELEEEVALVTVREEREERKRNLVRRTAG